MDFKQLEAFVSVIDNGSFSKAGKYLHLTQPTVSAHIASLEDETETKLISRDGSFMMPTEAGRILYGYAKNIIELRSSALEELRSYSKDMKGTIVVGASSIPGQYFLPKILSGFREIYPDIKFDVKLYDSADVVKMVARRKVDIGFCGSKLDEKNCCYKEFADDKLVIIAPNENKYKIYADTCDILPEDFLMESFVMREEGSGTRKETEIFFKKIGLDPSDIKTAVVVCSNESVKEMVSEGIGMSVISENACKNDSRLDKFIVIDCDNIRYERKLYVVKHKGSMLSHIAQVFYDYAKEFYEINKKE